MVRIVLVSFFIFMAGCSTSKNTSWNIPGAIDTTSERELVKGTVEAVQSEKQSSKAVNDLVFAANMCATKLENITISLNQCYASSSEMKSDLSVCSSNLEEMKKLHRWDWFGNFGDTIKGFFYGSLFTVIALVVLAFVARARKLISF